MINNNNVTASVSFHVSSAVVLTHLSKETDEQKKRKDVDPKPYSSSYLHSFVNPFVTLCVSQSALSKPKRTVINLMKSRILLLINEVLLLSEEEFKITICEIY